MKLTGVRVFGALALLACGVLAAIPALAWKPRALDKPQAIAITAKPVPLDRDKPQQTRFGKLIWRGTVELTSPAANFGGYSGLDLNSAGTRLVAVSDAGSWLTAGLVYRGGRIEKLVDAKIGPLRARDGKPLHGRNIDAEAIAFAKPGKANGEAYIAFEQNHRIGLFPVAANAIAAPKRYLPLPARASRAPGNTGLEAITVLEAGPARGALLALTEKYFDEAGNHIGWLIGGPAPGRLSLKRRNGFAVTDLTTLPDGDIVVLERRFRFTEGIKMRLRRIRAADIRPGALLDGEVLFETGDLREIDNMEGLAAHRDSEGKTILTLISDDNFNHTFQRILLMQFALPEN